jgi:hypothetical protein
MSIEQCREEMYADEFEDYLAYLESRRELMSESWD